MTATYGDSDYNGSFHLKYNLNRIVKTIEINDSKKINNNNIFKSKNQQMMFERRRYKYLNSVGFIYIC
jgi:hypothetical protein